VMDFNPDEAIAAGWLRTGSLAARILERMSLFSLRNATRIIALDRFMRDRIVAKNIPAKKITVVPPWSHDGEVRFDSEGRERFRQAHGLTAKFVVMYSGNHSPCHPLDTLLSAAEKLAEDPDVIFCFIGGGSEWRRIKEKVESRKQIAEMSAREQVSVSASPHASGVDFSEQQAPLASDFGLRTSESSNILCLPYQPLSRLSASLSAADLHVVIMGNSFVGLVHPCKIYNILTVAAPVLYIGPSPSHLSEVLHELNGSYPCWSAPHGSVDDLVGRIKLAQQQHLAVTRQAPSRTLSKFSKHAILPKLISILEAD